MACGRYGTTIGATMNTAVNTDSPAAVFLRMPPRATPMTAATDKYRAAPTTVRSTPGSVSEIAAAPRDECRAVTAKNSATVASRVTGNTRPASTTSFAPSTGSRDGTTASDARIIPEPYSPLNVSTPSAPTTSWANRTPSRLTDTAVAAGNCGDTLCLVPEPAIATPRPTISTTAISTQYQVDR